VTQVQLTELNRTYGPFQYIWLLACHVCSSVLNNEVKKGDIKPPEICLNQHTLM